MRVLDSEFAKGFVRLAEDGYNHGFHERNGGNLSYRLTAEDVESVREELDFSRVFVEIGTAVPTLAGEFFMVTGTGQYFHNVLRLPDVTAGIIEVDATGTKYRTLWGYTGGGRPTSELPTHLMIHEVKKAATNGAHRVLYHCHPANVIAMTFVLPVHDQIVTRELWESMTECPVVFPEGVGIVPWMVCGGRDIAVATAEKMKKYNVCLWAHHGVLCSGEDFDLTFGLVHTVEKSAEIYMKVRAVTEQKVQTITRQNFIDLGKAFGFTVPEEMLEYLKD